MKRASIIIGIGAAMTLLLAGCSGPADSGAEGSGTEQEKPASDVVLTWETTGGPGTEKEKKAFQDPYTEATGVTFENVTSSTAINQIQTMVETGNVLWDVTHKGSHIGAAHCGVLFEELDFESSDEMYPEGSTSPCSRPLQRYGSAFAYDFEVYKDKAPTRIEDFFDTDAFPGKRVIYGANPRGVFEMALVADGVDPQGLYPLDIDRAIAKLDTIKDDLIFAATFTALQQNVVDKQATMTITLTGRMGSIYDAGGTIAPVWDFTSWDFDGLFVPKGSPNKEEATKAIEFALEKEQVIRYAEIQGGAPARDDIDLSLIGYSDTHKIFNPFLNADKGGDLVLMDPQWWAKNLATATEKYVSWQVG